MTGVAWFIDGAYALKCWRNVAGDRHLDYVRFRHAIEANAKEEIGDAYYFNSDNDPPSAAQNGFHRAISKRPPDGAGLRVKLGSLQRKKHFWPAHMGGGPVLHPDDPNQQYETKSQKEVDVLLAFYLTLSYQTRGWKKLYLVAGDRDFIEPVRRLVEDEGVELIMFGVRGGNSAIDGRPYFQSISSIYDPISRAIYFEDHVDALAMNDVEQDRIPPRADEQGGVEELVDDTNA